MKATLKDKPNPNDPVIDEPTKEDVRGKRNPKKKNKDYDKKYGDKYDNWN